MDGEGGTDGGSAVVVAPLRREPRERERPPERVERASETKRSEGLTEAVGGSVLTVTEAVGGARMQAARCFKLDVFRRFSFLLLLEYQGKGNFIYLFIYF